jgi:hypothetical protein
LTDSLVRPNVVFSISVLETRQAEDGPGDAIIHRVNEWPVSAAELRPVNVSNVGGSGCSGELLNLYVLFMLAGLRQLISRLHPQQGVGLDAERYRRSAAGAAG